MLVEAQAIKDGKHVAVEERWPTRTTRRRKSTRSSSRATKMSELIDSFEPTKARETANIERAQATIVQLLQSVSRRLGMSENVDGMSKSKLDEMNDDLEFKQSQMDHSISTSERLQRELQQRRLELE